MCVWVKKKCQNRKICVCLFMCASVNVVDKEKGDCENMDINSNDRFL